MLDHFPIIDQIEALSLGGTPSLVQQCFFQSLLARACEQQGKPTEAAQAKARADAAARRLEEMAAPK